MNPLLKVIQLYKNEAKLVKKASRNNRDAQRLLFEVRAAKMLSVCRYYISDLQHAEEAMLNGFLKVFSNLNSFKNEGSFEGWIRRIMVRESISFLKQKKHVEFFVEDVETHYEYTNEIETGIEAEEIQQLLDALPDGYQLVFLMYAIEGYKHHEIAKALNITEGTSKSQLFKSRKMLQQKINELNKTSYGTN